MENTMENRENRASLPFFGIPRLVPYMRKYRKILSVMIICGLAGSAVDIAMPLFQKR